MPRRSREPSKYRSQESTYQHDTAQKYDLIDPAQPWSGESMLKDVPIAEPRNRSPCSHSVRHAVTFAIIVVLAPTLAASEPAPQDLKRLSIEQLMQIDVTLATRCPEPVATAPTVISVVTGEDIRRSGVTTLADAIGLADGIHVARFNTGTRFHHRARFRGGRGQEDDHHDRWADGVQPVGVERRRHAARRRLRADSSTA